MDELKKIIEQILDQFAKEELGNRLSQFAMISLKNLILMEIDKKVEAKESTPKAAGAINDLDQNAILEAIKKEEERKHDKKQPQPLKNIKS